jgi:hypothetical protein
VNANPFIAAIVSMPSTENGFGYMAPLSMFEMLKGNEINITKVERINDAIATGLALKTKSKFDKNVKTEKMSISNILKSFYDKKNPP